MVWEDFGGNSNLVRRLAACTLLMVISGHARAQEEGEEVEEPRRSTFETMGIRPTGQNGIEEIIAAGDLLRDCKLLTEVQSTEATLTLKRKALNDPIVKRALDLVRTGLRKPIKSLYDKINNDTLFPQYALCRSIARTLMLEQYVLLADGRVAEAISSMEDSLFLGKAIQTDSLLSGMVGHAIIAIGLTRIARSVDQLSVRDCDRIVAICRTVLKEPGCASAILEKDREMWASSIIDMCKDSHGTLKEILEDEEEPLSHELAVVINGSPGIESKLLEQAGNRIDEYLKRLISNAGLPAWKRENLEFSKDTLVDKLADHLMFSGSQAMNGFDREESSFHLLAIHAAIKRYQWEHDQLPDSLRQIHLGDLAIDPYTGGSIQYERKGDSYELFCAGPVDRDDDGKPIPGKRVPLYLPFRPKKHVD